MRRLAAALTLLALSASARGEVVLRMATAAPEGTAWAREAHAWARLVESATNGSVRIKLYFGGITGDELQTAERIRRQQLDGIASGGMLCMQVSPSMRVLRIPGLFQSREESAFVGRRLRTLFADEARHAGFEHLGEIAVGPDMPFLARPARSFDELKRARLWLWDLDPVLAQAAPVLGLSVVRLPLGEAAAAFDAKRTDGFLAVPTAALAFQWSTQARYVLDLRVGYLRGCLLISTQAFDKLQPAEREAVRSTAAQLIARLEELSDGQDAQLLGGLFQRQGLEVLPASPALRAQFLDAARAARETLGDKLAPAEVVQKVMGLLADFRAEHKSPPATP